MARGKRAHKKVVEKKRDLERKKKVFTWAKGSRKDSEMSSLLRVETQRLDPCGWNMDHRRHAKGGSQRLEVRGLQGFLELGGGTG